MVLYGDHIMTDSGENERGNRIMTDSRESERGKGNRRERRCGDWIVGTRKH